MLGVGRPRGVDVGQGLGDGLQATPWRGIILRMKTQSKHKAKKASHLLDAVKQTSADLGRKGPVKDQKMTAFEKDLLESIRQAKRGEGRVTKVAVTAATEARMKLGVSQSAFAKLLGVSVRTLQEWEQGRREPSGAARTLLRIALRSPEAFLQAG